MIQLVDKMINLKKEIASPDDVVKANELVKSVFEDIKRNKG